MVSFGIALMRMVFSFLGVKYLRPHYYISSPQSCQYYGIPYYSTLTSNWAIIYLWLKGEKEVVSILFHGWAGSIKINLEPTCIFFRCGMAPSEKYVVLWYIASVLF